MYFYPSKTKQLLVSALQSYVKCNYTYSITMLNGLNTYFEVILFKILVSNGIFAVLVFLLEKVLTCPALA
jgi:hypothetical protein